MYIQRTLLTILYIKFITEKFTNIEVEYLSENWQQHQCIFLISTVYVYDESYLEQCKQQRHDIIFAAVKLRFSLTGSSIITSTLIFGLQNIR